MQQTRAIFKDASTYLYSRRVDESILDNFDELNESILDDLDAQSVSSVSQIDKDVVSRYSCSVLLVLNIKSGLTATNTDLRLVSERLSEVCEQSRLFKHCALTSVVLESTDSDTGEVITEELEPNNIKPGYDTLRDFFERTDHKGLYVTIPDGQITFEVTFEPRKGLTLEKYAHYLRQFMDRAESVITRANKDYGYMKFFVYDKPNMSSTFPFFRQLATVIVIESYELIYDKEINLESDISDIMDAMETSTLDALETSVN